jgi:transposase
MIGHAKLLLDRVGRVIEEQFGVAYHPGHVWKILRQLNWSPQLPVGRAIERNEAAIGDWQKNRWPAIKKKPRPRAGRSSSSTKAG